jgi:hypothetical protein
VVTEVGGSLQAPAKAGTIEPSLTKEWKRANPPLEPPVLADSATRATHDGAGPLEPWRGVGLGWRSRWAGCCSHQLIH